MSPPIVEGRESAPQWRHRSRRVVLCLSASILLCVQTSIAARAQDKPSKGKIRLLVAADTARATPGRSFRQVDVEESASELRKRARGLQWVELANRLADADVIVTVTGRYKDPNRGFVLSYILEAGEYRVEDEFAYQGGTDMTGGIRTLESDGRASVEGRRPLSWDELAKQFAKSLEGFAKGNYDRILRRRDRGHPNGAP
jgi:hypothetical protein